MEKNHIEPGNTQGRSPFPVFIDPPENRGVGMFIPQCDNERLFLLLIFGAVKDQLERQRAGNQQSFIGKIKQPGLLLSGGKRGNKETRCGT